MIGYEVCILTLSGENFNPDCIDSFLRSGDVVNKTYKGMVATRGRYKGDVNPYGIVYVNSTFERVIEIMEAMEIGDGFFVDDRDVCLVIQYSEQCNFEIDSDLMGRFCKFGINLGISCYEA